MPVQAEDTKNVPYFVQKLHRDRDNQAFFNNFTLDEHAIADEMELLLDAAYIAKEVYPVVTRKTKMVIKVEQVINFSEKAHQKMKMFAAEHGFKRSKMTANGSFNYFYMKPKK